MGVTTGNPHGPKRTLCIADLCQAIANGQIVPAVEASCYKISNQDVRKVSETLDRATPHFSSPLPQAMQPGWETASEVGCLAQSGPCG